MDICVLIFMFKFMFMFMNMFMYMHVHTYVHVARVCACVHVYIQNQLILVHRKLRMDLHQGENRFYHAHLGGFLGITTCCLSFNKYFLIVWLKRTLLANWRGYSAALTVCVSNMSTPENHFAVRLLFHGLSSSKYSSLQYVTFGENASAFERPHVPPVMYSCK